MVAFIHDVLVTGVDGSVQRVRSDAVRGRP